MWPVRKENNSLTMLTAPPDTPQTCSTYEEVMTELRFDTSEKVSILNVCCRDKRKVLLYRYFLYTKSTVTRSDHNCDIEIMVSIALLFILVTNRAKKRINIST